MSFQTPISSSRVYSDKSPDIWKGWIKVSECSPETIYVGSDSEGDVKISKRRVNEAQQNFSKSCVDNAMPIDDSNAGRDRLDFEYKSVSFSKTSKTDLSNSISGVEGRQRKCRRLVRRVSKNDASHNNDDEDLKIIFSDSQSKIVDDEAQMEDLIDLLDGDSSQEERDTEFDNVLKQCQEYSNRLNNLLQKRVSRKVNKVVGMEQQPKTLNNSLKEYQLIGLNWLYLLHTEGLSGILADGKTVQTISLLTLLKEKGYRSLHMIVVPASTIDNWRRELARWSLSLDVFLYYGTQAERAEFRLAIMRNRSRFESGIGEREYNFDVLLTTFQTATGKSDRNFLKKIDFEYLVVDEAQMLKGNETARYEVFSKFNSKYRLLLTGTPLQNNLDELASLLQFLMPNFFSNLKNNKMAREVRELLKQRRKITENEYVQKMKDILEPFILRRLKSEVGIELVPKKHKIVHIKMPDIQRRVYEDIFSSTKKFLNQKAEGDLDEFDFLDVNSRSASAADDGNNGGNEVDLLGDESGGRKKGGGGKSKNNKKKWDSKKLATMSGFMNNMLMQMRKVSNHPVFVRSFYSENALIKLAKDAMVSDVQFSKLSLDEVLNDFSFLSDLQLHYRAAAKPNLHSLKLTDEQLFYSSGKMLVLSKLLPQLQKQGHRIAMFSQFTTVLDMMELFLTQILKIKYLRLDGSTPVIERQNLIDKFNNQPSYFILLLTTQAGGLGINLTSADTVIFHDISYNPQVDKQAEDRCHRIGQNKEVTVYILLTIGTVEDHMYSMARAKTELNDLMLNEGKFAVNNMKDEVKPKVSMLRNLAQRIFLEKQLSFEEKEEWIKNDEGMELYITSVD